MNGSTWVLYHRDADGFMSGFIARKKLEELGRRDIKMHSIQYRESLPNINYDFDEVYMLDFSLPDQEMRSFADKLGDRLAWVDHHQTAADTEKKMELFTVRGRRIAMNDEKIAACELCWEYFWPGRKMPEAVMLVGDWDTFRWENMPEDSNGKRFARFFARFIDSLGLDPSTAEARHVLKESIDEPISAAHAGINIGRRMCDGEDKANAIMMRDCSFTAPMTVDGRQYTALVVNQKGNSKMFESAINKEVHDILVAYRMRGVDLVDVSFYRVSDSPHCGRIARYLSREGGGHAGAAGCVVPASLFWGILGMPK